MSPRFLLFTAAATAICQLTPVLAETHPLPKWPGEALHSPVTPAMVDAEAYAEWMDGAEKKIEPSPTQKGDGPLRYLGTGSTHSGHGTLVYGDTKTPGVRHLRFGFKEPVRVGSVFTKEGGALSVLKADAPYPGDLGNDAHWLPAQRLEAGKVVTTAPAEDGYGLWILPPNTDTRALRFTHHAKPTDEKYQGRLGGVLICPERLFNEAWQASAGASTNNQYAARILNGKSDNWSAWENQEKNKAPADSVVISDTAPQYITLTWQRETSLDGLVALWAGMGTVEVQSFQGAADHNPKDAGDADWKSIATYEDVKHAYPVQLWPNWLPFPATVKTRAIRLRITDAGTAGGHTTTNGGRRVWLGELMAMRRLGDAPLRDAEWPAQVAKKAQPPIPIPFTLSEPGFVSLVIEKPDGFRVRNLVSETPFPAGKNTVWWDGTDDLGRDQDAANHGVYRIPPRFVEPGEYRVRGLVRGDIRPHYEFSVYTTGNPPWTTEDDTGAWLANHSPPQAAAFVPAAQSPTGQPVVYLGCYVTEGPSGLAWVDLKGNKLGGKKWIGGHWTAAPYLARDNGQKPTSGTHVYVASTWETGKKSGEGELRITALTDKGDKELLKHSIGEMKRAGGDSDFDQLGGIAVYNGIAAVSMPKMNRLLIIDLSAGKILTDSPLPSPRGVAFTAEGALLVLAEKQLLKFPSHDTSVKPTVPVSSGLENPMGLTLDGAGSVYISDWGASHQVKVFTIQGKLLRTVGRPGEPAAGRYDPLHMNHPHGMAVDDQQQLWVTEHDYMPKRVSVWSPDGKLVRAFYGPGKYGGGGALDPQDKTRFYYADEGRGTLEFKLDWTTGGYELENVLYRRSKTDLALSLRAAAPEHTLYHEGKRYFTNAYNSSPTGGHGVAFLFTEREGLARPAVAMGNANRWEILKDESFRARWPEGVDLTAKKEPDAFFIWSDLNDDARVQPEEVEFQKAKSGGITIMSDLSFCAARVNGTALQFQPVGFTAAGVPLYKFSQSKVLAERVQNPKSSGGDQALAGTGGWSVVTLGIGPFDGLSISGARNGQAKWSYPSPWPGLHAGHRAPRSSQPGQLIATTRLPGGFFEMKGSSAGPLWALHSNHGSMAVFTQDGIFVANLFAEMRVGQKWRMPTATRNMELTGLSLGEENFWPTLTHASDGKVYLVDGARSAIVRLDGFETLQRLPDTPLTVSVKELEQSRKWRQDAEADRQRSTGTGVLKVARLAEAPKVDGTLPEWSAADWVDIDRSGVKAYFNADSKPYEITGSMAVSGDRLYAAWQTGATAPLQNSGAMPLAPFKTGDALDLMIGPAGDRKSPVAGDMRLIVTLVDKKPKALLYRAVVPNTKDADKVPFSSPWRTITFDKVEDVSSLVEFASKDGNHEISIPLAKLGIESRKGTKLRGDIGILRGDGGETAARTYWNNKATSIISDVPEEASLSPQLWGILEFQ